MRYFPWERERDTDRGRERERERERRKWRHHCRAKIGDEFTLSLAKTSHFSFLPSHFPSLHSRRGHHCGAEIRNEFTESHFPLPKFFRPLFSPSFKWHEPRDEWSKTQDKWSTWSNHVQSYYRKRGSASYIVREVRSVRERDAEREREREREGEKETEIDGSDVIIVALKLAMSLHFPMQKKSHNCCEFTLSLAKKSHFTFLPSHFISHQCGAEMRSSHFPLPKNSPSLFRLSLE